MISDSARVDLLDALAELGFAVPVSVEPTALEELGFVAPLLPSPVPVVRAPWPPPSAEAFVMSALPRPTERPSPFVASAPLLPHPEPSRPATARSPVSEPPPQPPAEPASTPASTSQRPPLRVGGVPWSVYAPPWDAPAEPPPPPSSPPAPAAPPPAATASRRRGSRRRAAVIGVAGFAVGFGAGWGTSWITDANGRAEIAPAVIGAQTTVSRYGTNDAGSFTATPTA